MKPLITNRLEPVFGPIASFAGIFLAAAGIAICYISFTGVILIIIGSFIGLTYISSTIDTKNKRVRLTTNFFGFIKSGKWVDMDPSMNLEITKNNKVYRGYSRSNRTLDIKAANYQILLLDENNQPIMPLKYFNSHKQGKDYLTELTDKLNIPTHKTTL